MQAAVCDFRTALNFDLATSGGDVPTAWQAELSLLHQEMGEALGIAAHGTSSSVTVESQPPDANVPIGGLSQTHLEMTLEKYSDLLVALTHKKLSGK